MPRSDRPPADHNCSMSWQETGRTPVSRTGNNGQQECAEVVWETEKCQCGATGGSKSSQTNWSSC